MVFVLLSFPMTMTVHAATDYYINLVSQNGVTVTFSPSSGTSNSFTATYASGGNTLGTITVTGNSLTLNGNAISCSSDSSEDHFTLSASPATGYTCLSNGNPFTGESTPGSDANNGGVYNIDFVAANNGGGNNPPPSNATRSMTLKIMGSQKDYLANQNFTMGYSDYQDYSVQITDMSNLTVTGSYRQDRDFVCVNAQLTNEFFFPTFRAVITYDGDSTPREYISETWDVGQGNIAAEFPIEPGSSDVTITMYPQVDKSASASVASGSGVSSGTVQYCIFGTDGNAQIASDATVTLGVAETSDDSSAASTYGADFDGTLDITFSVNGRAQTTLTTASTITLNLDRSSHSGTNYGVARNHNGTLTMLSSHYDPNTGALSFESDLFSSYSLIRMDAPTTVKEEKSAYERHIEKTAEEITSTFYGTPAIIDGKKVRVYEYNVGDALPVTIMEALTKANDMVFYYTYTYKGVVYRATITPEAAKKAFSASIPWYGPLYLQAHFPVEVLEVLPDYTE